MMVQEYTLSPIRRSLALVRSGKIIEAIETSIDAPE